MKIAEKIKTDLRTDVTWNRAARLGAEGARALPSASVRYAVDKFPIIGWLPKYNPRWIVNDLIAGLTIGLMLIPQGLSYAKIADIPVEYGLMSSWLPAAIYAFMGTTKGENIAQSFEPLRVLTAILRCIDWTYLPHRAAHIRKRTRASRSMDSLRNRIRHSFHDGCLWHGTGLT